MKRKVSSACPKLIPIDLSQGHNHKLPGIVLGKLYLVKYDGQYAIGDFTRQWYGLSFNGFYDAGLQFDAPGSNSSRWQAVWEFVPEGQRPKEKP